MDGSAGTDVRKIASGSEHDGSATDKKVDALIAKARMRKAIEQKLIDEENAAKRKHTELMKAQKGASDLQRAIIGVRGGLKDDDFIEKINQATDKGITFDAQGVPMMFKKPKNTKNLMETGEYGIND